MTPEQAAELKRLVEAAIDAVDSNLKTFVEASNKLYDYIDSLTQPCPASHVCDCQEAGQQCAKAQPPAQAEHKHRHMEEQPDGTMIPTDEPPAQAELTDAEIEAGLSLHAEEYLIHAKNGRTV